MKRQRPLRLAVRTLPFHGEDTGSIPVGVTRPYNNIDFIVKMKNRSSLKKLKVRQKNLIVVRRGKRVYVLPQEKKDVKDFNNRFKAKQGY